MGLERRLAALQPGFWFLNSTPGQGLGSCGGGLGAFNYLKVSMKGAKSPGKGEQRQMVCPRSWESIAGCMRVGLEEVGEMNKRKGDGSKRGTGPQTQAGPADGLSLHQLVAGCPSTTPQPQP